MNNVPEARPEKGMLLCAALQYFSHVLPTSKMNIEKDRIKNLVNDFTSQTFGTKIPEGLSFSNCSPLFIHLRTASPSLSLS